MTRYPIEAYKLFGWSPERDAALRAEQAAAFAAYAATPEGAERLAEEAADEALAIAEAKAEREDAARRDREQRRREREADVVTIRAPYTGRVVSRFRVR